MFPILRKVFLFEKSRTATSWEGGIDLNNNGKLSQEEMIKVSVKDRTQLENEIKKAVDRFVEQDNARYFDPCVETEVQIVPYGFLQKFFSHPYKSKLDLELGQRLIQINSELAELKPQEDPNHPSEWYQTLLEHRDEITLVKNHLPHVKFLEVKDFPAGFAATYYPLTQELMIPKGWDFSSYLLVHEMVHYLNHHVRTKTNPQTEYKVHCGPGNIKTVQVAQQLRGRSTREEAVYKSRVNFSDSFVSKAFEVYYDQELYANLVAYELEHGKPRCPTADDTRVTWADELLAYAAQARYLLAQVYSLGFTVQDMNDVRDPNSPKQKSAQAKLEALLDKIGAKQENKLIEDYLKGPVVLSGSLYRFYTRMKAPGFADYTDAKGNLICDKVE